MEYFLKKEVKLDFDEAVKRVTEELVKEGFGVINDIDLAEIFKAKLNDDFRPYRILGACNPVIAKKALEIDDQIGALLPCNVVVQKKENGGVIVSAVNSQALLSISKRKKLENAAAEIDAKLKKVLANL